MQGSCQNKWSCVLLFFDLGYIETLRDENTPYWNSSALFSNFSPSFFCISYIYLSLPISFSPPLFCPSSPLYQKSTSSASSEASETCQSVSECNSPTAVSTACVSSFYWTYTFTDMHTFRHSSCDAIYSLLSEVKRGLWVLLDSHSADWCELVKDVERSDSDLSVRSAVWLMLILWYLSPCFLSHWHHHQASLCHTSCVPHI